MNTVDFCSMHPSNSVEVMFKEHFAELMAAYDLLEGLRFCRIDSVDIDKSIIIYSITLEEQDKNKIIFILNRYPVIKSLGSYYNIHAWVDNSNLLYIKLDKYSEG